MSDPSPGCRKFVSYCIYTIYNMNGCVVSDIQTQAKDERLYVRYNTDANK